MADIPTGIEEFFSRAPMNENKNVPERVEMDPHEARELVAREVEGMFTNLYRSLPDFAEKDADMDALYSFTKAILQTSSLPADQQKSALMERIHTQGVKRNLPERVSRLLQFFGEIGK